MDADLVRRLALAEHVRQTRYERFGTKAKAARAFEGSLGSYEKAEADGRSQPATWVKIENLFGWPVGSSMAFLQGRGPLPGTGATNASFVADASDVVEQTMTEDEILARVQAARADLNAALDDLTRIRGEGS